MADKPWSITIAPDKLSASLIIEHDCDTTAEEIEKDIISKGITFGRIPDAVNQAMQLRGNTITIAEGKAPQPGHPAEVTFYVDEAMLTAEINASVADNLRQEMVVPSVEPGQVLAKLTPAVPGIAGTSIYDKEVPPPPVETINFRALKGALLSDDGLEVTAAVTGRPRMEKKRKLYSFQVNPCYIRRGDVTTQHGHITFQGDISIFGNVTEGTLVTAQGNIEIYGNVIGATISAGQSITVSGNTIQGTLKSGVYFMLVEEILSILEEFDAMFSTLVIMLKQLAASPQLARLPFSHLVKQTIIMRSIPWEETIKKLEKEIDKIKTPALADAVNDARKITETMSNYKWNDVVSLVATVSQIKEVRRKFEESMGSGGDIKAAYTLNSKLTSSRSIIVKGQGCMHSHLKAEDEVRIEGRLRGGTVITKNYIYAREVGSEAGAVTNLSVLDKGRIEVDKAYENTAFTVGRFTYTLTDTIGRSRTAFNSDGHLYLLHR